MASNNRYLDEPPGTLILSAIGDSEVAKDVVRHLGITQLIDDHQIIWSQAETDVGKVKAHTRFQRQMIRSLASFGGFEIAVHGVVMTCLGNWVTGGSFLIVGAAIFYLTRG